MKQREKPVNTRFSLKSDTIKRLVKKCMSTAVQVILMHKIKFSQVLFVDSLCLCVSKCAHLHLSRHVP